MRPHPTTLADAVRLYRQYGEGQDGAFSVLLDEFLDAFYTEVAPARRQIMIYEAPPRIGEERHDAYVGAVGEHLARRWGLQIPPWTGAPVHRGAKLRSRGLSEGWATACPGCCWWRVRSRSGRAASSPRPSRCGAPVCPWSDTRRPVWRGPNKVERRGSRGYKSLTSRSAS